MTAQNSMLFYYKDYLIGMALCSVLALYIAAIGCNPAPSMVQHTTRSDP